MLMLKVACLIVTGIASGLVTATGLFAAGIFIGTFLLCLAETVKALPILTHRVCIKKGIGFIIMFIAVGKCVGHLIYYLLAYV